MSAILEQVLLSFDGMQAGRTPDGSLVVVESKCWGRNHRPALTRP
jgi:hypothetical protein